jgi:glucose/arabinose dehydrogenase
MKRGLSLGLLVAALGCGPEGQTEIETHSFNPDAREATAERIGALRPPEGYTVAAYATGLGNPRMIAVAPAGGVYVTRPASGDVIWLHDADGNGTAEQQKVVASGHPNVHGIAVRGQELFLATTQEILVAAINPDATLGDRRTLVSDLPDGGQHGRRTIDFSPDGWLYVSIGSTCNACWETNPEHATILRMRPDGTQRAVYARGLRNTIGFDWHPLTGQLWGMDHGSDDRGDNQPPEELNQLLEGRDYGWPYAFGDRLVDEKTLEPPTGPSKAERAATSEPATLTYQAHSAPIEFVFAKGASEFQGDAFAAMRGSWNRYPATGYKLVRIRFENGTPTRFEDFVTGWLIENGGAHFGRLAGLAILPDGSILLSEDTNGVLYRIAKTSFGQ